MKKLLFSLLLVILAHGMEQQVSIKSPDPLYEKERKFLYNLLQNDEHLQDLLIYAQQKPTDEKSQIIKRYADFLIDKTLKTLTYEEAPRKDDEKYNCYLMNELAKRKQYTPNGSREYDYFKTGKMAFGSTCEVMVNEFKKDLEEIRKAIALEKTNH